MRKVLRFLFVIVLSVWAVDLSAQSQAVQFFAHRASRFEYDENTLPAFKACYEHVNLTYKGRFNKIIEV